MGYVRDAFNLMLRREVKPSDVKSGSVVDLLMALEKRAVAGDAVANSLVDRIVSQSAALGLLLERVTEQIAHQDDLTTLLGRVEMRVAEHSDMQTLLDRVRDRAAEHADMQTLLGRVTAARADRLDNLRHIAGSVARSSDVATLLSRLTMDRAGYLDNLDGFSKSTLRSQVFTADGTWMRPDNVSAVWVTMCGGGGGGGSGHGPSRRTDLSPARPGRGGVAGLGGLFVINHLVPVSGNVDVVVGAAGLGSNPTLSPSRPRSDGGNSAFGSLVTPGGGVSGSSSFTAALYPEFLVNTARQNSLGPGASGSGESAPSGTYGGGGNGGPASGSSVGGDGAPGVVMVFWIG